MSVTYAIENVFTLFGIHCQMQLKVCPLLLCLDHLLRSTVSAHAHCISIQRAAPFLLSLSQSSPWGISAEPLLSWGLLGPLIPVSLGLTPVTLWITLQCPQVCICCYSRQWQAATAGKNASENKTRLLQNELKVWAVKLFLFEQHWSLSRSDWLLIVEPFRWEIHLMELKSLFLFYFFTIDSEKATAATAQKSRWIHEDRNLRRKKSIAITVCSVWCWSLISLWVSVSM